MTPWYYYMEYGDEGILRKNFGMMRDMWIIWNGSP